MHIFSHYTIYLVAGSDIQEEIYDDDDFSFQETEKNLLKLTKH